MSSQIERARTLANQLLQDFPSCSPKLETFPSGAFMLDVTAPDEVWVMEYLPSLSAFGVSRTSTATFGWEGLENAFDTFEEAERFLRGLLPK